MSDNDYEYRFAKDDCDSRLPPESYSCSFLFWLSVYVEITSANGNDLQDHLTSTNQYPITITIPARNHTRTRTRSGYQLHDINGLHSAVCSIRSSAF